MRRKTNLLSNIFLFTFLLTFLTACTDFIGTATPRAVPPIETKSKTPTAVPETALPSTENKPPQILHIWLPPQFDPAAETDAGMLLRTRLDTFQRRRPDIIIEVRIKSTEGEASLLNALLATHQVAPTIMPDLVALTHADLESAAKEGILHPIDGLTTLLDDPNWFPYARSLAHIQDSAYGLPFAANLLGLRYTPTEEFPIPAIENLLEQEKQIIFPVDNADLSFCLYIASGNSLQSEEGQPTLNEEPLTALLNFYRSDVISPISVDEEILEPENTLPILWSNAFFDETPADALLVPIPGPEGVNCSLASAWMWSLAGNNPDLQPDAVELAEYLSDSAFLAEWTAASGYLPPRPTALDETKTTLHELSLIAQPMPSNDIVEVLGNLFREATMSVLQDQVDPSAAAQEALEHLQ